MSHPRPAILPSIPSQSYKSSAAAFAQAHWDPVTEPCEVEDRVVGLSEAEMATVVGSPLFVSDGCRVTSYKNLPPITE